MSSTPAGVIGITPGDAAGIGPEIIRQALDSGKLDPDFLYKIIGDIPECTPGQPTPDTARAALATLETSAKLAGSGEVAAIVTGPINKHRMQEVGFEFPGQTEFFAARSGTENFAMLLTGGSLTVALVTAHVPLKDVAGLLNEREIIRVGKLLAAFLKLRKAAFGKIDHEMPAEILSDPEARQKWMEERVVSLRPRIAVAGLNPHAGESGKVGSEEIEIIKPAVKELHRNKFSDAIFEGPISPDTVFNRAVNGEFDGVLCMYHDQGLIPLKLHAFDQGVNVTIGLPYIRTSPDHGTAFEIAGKEIARPDSMIAAINLAAELVKKRRLSR